MKSKWALSPNIDGAVWSLSFEEFELCVQFAKPSEHTDGGYWFWWEDLTGIESDEEYETREDAMKAGEEAMIHIAHDILSVISDK